VKRLRITVNGVSYDVEVEVLEDDEEQGDLLNPLPTPPGRRTVPAQPVTPPTPPPAVDGRRVLTSPIAGIVQEILTAIGVSVDEHEPVVVIEAMKMKTNISSPVSARVKTIEVVQGDSVRQGQVLVTFE